MMFRVLSLIALTSTLLAAPAGAADLKVISAGAVRGLITQMIEDYSKQTGQKFDFTIGTTGQTRTGNVAAVLLYNNKLECSSCHDVHNTFTVGSVGSGLVKVSSSGSAGLCFACHNK